MDEKLSENILSGLDGVVTINGSINQTQAITGSEKQKKYNLTYDAIELKGEKNYFLIHLTFEDGTVNTYFLPIQFLGLQTVVFGVLFQVASIQFYIYGNLKLKDTFLKSLIADPLTEEQKQALDKVTTNSEYWDRILAITNSLGNVITDKLEGSINTALNTITGASGKMYWEDGKFICRDATTDEESTMAMMISPGGFMIADSKQSDGNWNWRTFGTGKGFVADEIIAGTLRAIAVEGVNITGSVITGGTINGVNINGSTITGSTIYVGDISIGNYIELSPNNPIKIWRNKKIVSSLGYSDVGGGNLTIYDVGGQEAFKVECLEDGNLRLYGNDTPGFIPDKEHDPDGNLGIVKPNPNARYMEIISGRVLFQEGSAGVMKNGYFRRFMHEEDLWRYSKIGHKHTTSYSSGHAHEVYGDY